MNFYHSRGYVMKTVKRFLDERLDLANKRTDEAEKLRVKFVQDYPIEKILQLKLEEFILSPKGSGYENTFCRRIRYELEGLAHMGNVWPNTFGVYLKNGTQYELSDGLKKQFGDDFEKAFVWIKEEIVCLLNSMKNDDYEKIVNSKLNSSFKYKLLIVYFPEKLIPVCTRSVLENYCACVGVETKSQEDSLYKNLKLKKAKDESPVFAKWTNSLFMQFCDWLMRNDKSVDISKLDITSMQEKGKISMKKYSVNDAVWIATALMANEMYDEHHVLSEEYYYFKQVDIVKRAQMLTEDNVDNARVSWWCCADAKKHIYNYLRSGLAFDNNTRRLSMLDEFPEKTYPEGLDMSDVLITEDKTLTMGELFAFVKEEYSSIFKGENSNSSYWPSLEEYNPGISKEKWIELLQDSNVTSEDILIMLYRMLELGGESTCSNLAEQFGGSAFAYNVWGRTLGEHVHKTVGCPLCKKGDKNRFYTIPFVGRDVWENGHDRYSWKLRDELKEALESDMISDLNKKLRENARKFINNMNKTEYAKNMILYGPPGTGKTYATVVYAVAIIEGKEIETVEAEAYSDVFARYEEYKKEGLVAFTTFHQSYGYEEFIEGIKPVVDADREGIGYTIEDGVFKNFCKNANMPINQMIDHNAKIWKVVLQSGDLVTSNTVKFECFNEGKIMYDWKTKEEHIGTYAFNQIEHFQERVNIGDVVVSYAGAGTDIDAIGIITGDAVYDEKKTNYRWSRSVEWIEYNNVRNIKELNGDKYLDNDQLQHLKRVNILELLKLAETQSFKPNDKSYVFIIDEINRGNISKIFGELITLIEDTKRTGTSEETTAILPYSGETFSVPSNVYILGTMNTADRSIALMDTALRRRFEFVEMMPEANVLRQMGADKVEDLDVALMLEKINERITFLYDREHTIGHAFFTKLAKDPTIDTLKSIFEKSVIPLLQEYFYEDYQKIQMVLGDNGKSDDKYKFIVDSQVKAKDIFKENVDEIIDLPEKKYSINKEAFKELQSYREII